MNLDLFPRPLYIIKLAIAGEPGYITHKWTSRSKPEDLGGAVRFICAETGARMYVPGRIIIECIPALFHGSHSRAGYSDNWRALDFPSRYAPADPDRCTGRTTRMLARALKSYIDGKRVFVVAMTSAEIHHMRHLIDKHFSFRPPPVRFTLTTVDRLDGTRGLRPPHGVVYLDHDVCEGKHGNWINADLHALEHAGVLAT
jgi:hypothetical protein